MSMYPVGTGCRHRLYSPRHRLRFSFVFLAFIFSVTRYLSMCYHCVRRAVPVPYIAFLFVGRVFWRNEKTAL